MDMGPLTPLFAHLIGDYMLQSGWMANNKTKSFVPATVHACVYFIPFLLLLHPSLAASAIMIGTHALIDRYRLARYVAYLKEYLSPPSTWYMLAWADHAATGYHKGTPAFLSTWLMIIIDNVMHIIINALCLAYL